LSSVVFILHKGIITQVLGNYEVHVNNNLSNTPTTTSTTTNIGLHVWLAMCRSWVRARNINLIA